MMAKDKPNYSPSISTFHPSSPQRTNMINPARRIQLRRNTRRMMNDEGEIFVIKPQRVDFRSQVHSYNFSRTKHFFNRWKIKFRISENQNRLKKKSEPDNVFRLEISDDETESEGEITNLSHDERRARKIVSSSRKKLDNPDYENDSDDIQKFIDAGLHPPQPIIMPPRRDSQIKGFLRDLIPAKMFHITQLRQKEKKKLPIVTLPTKLNEPWSEVPDICHLIVDVVNEVNKGTDLSEFFYEMYLEMLEYSLNAQDSLLYKMIFPFEIVEDEFEANDQEQVKCMLFIADKILDNQLKTIIDM